MTHDIEKMLDEAAQMIRDSQNLVNQSRECLKASKKSLVFANQFDVIQPLRDESEGAIRAW